MPPPPPSPPRALPLELLAVWRQCGCDGASYWLRDNPDPSDCTCFHGYRVVPGKVPTQADQPWMQLMPCPNFEFCGEWATKGLLDAHMGRCLCCNMRLRQNLQFEDARPDWECPVCLQHASRIAKYPADCSHHLCLACLRRVFRMGSRDSEPELERRLGPDMRQYGCPSCQHGNDPNTCEMPNTVTSCRGVDCCKALESDTCEHGALRGTCAARCVWATCYDVTCVPWATANEAMHGAWYDEHDRRRQVYFRGLPDIACPICRAKSEDSVARSWSNPREESRDA